MTDVTVPSRPLLIGLLAGEASGDILGAGLIEALKKRYPDARFVGVGGARMQAAGLENWEPMDRLSVMGLVEPLKRLPELLAMRSRLRKRFLHMRPDAFIGIDSPDFNLTLERQLRRAGIPVLHYVSPSVWAWRRGRIRKIRKAVDRMLTLFPFEARFYEGENVPVSFVGHPLADRLDGEPGQSVARQALQCPAEGTLIALLPGSRAGEIRQMGELFLQVALRCLHKHPDWRFIVPAASPERLKELGSLLKPFEADLCEVADTTECPVKLVDGQSQLAMTAADAVLMASGTTTLEAMLLRRPMVVAYRMAPLSYAILSRLVTVPWVSLPNLLANRMLVPELLQDAATPDALAGAVMAWFDEPARREGLLEAFAGLHDSLRCDASERAADAVLLTIRECQSRQGAR
ncbi:MAG: lipid-A-disaccharide synthase [Gammaproteobacteria bacterium]|nr:MAG: lipid-A-disaccharide synthase [Gammaproteobacteria bacterium]